VKDKLMMVCWIALTAKYYMVPEKMALNFKTMEELLSSLFSSVAPE
jgi:hypothetical protein